MKFPRNIFRGLGRKTNSVPAVPAVPAPAAAPAGNSLAAIYDLLGSDPDALTALSLEPDVAPRSPLSRWVEGRRADRLTKALGEAMVGAFDRQRRAGLQGSVVNATFDVMNLYGSTSTPAVLDPTGLTYKVLRQLAHHCEPATAIIERRIRQVCAFSRPAKMTGSTVEAAGFRIKLADEEAQPTAADKRRIQQLTRYVTNCGLCPPPEAERSANWQPGFEAFLAQVVRDTLTLDWVAVRRWKDRKSPKKYPVVAFTAEDAGRVRRVRGQVESVVNGVKRRQEYVRLRETTGERIRFVKMDTDGGGGMVAEEFTADELAVSVRNPRTDEASLGAGYSELERAMNAITIWLYARDYNAMRFRTDALPRGVLTILGGIDQGQLNTFKSKWREMFSGVAKRWQFPVISATGEKAAVTWTSFDQSSRDMEYHQFMFSVSLWMHAIFGIHPEETGFEALSPFKPPLSEASPETKLQYSQDSGLAPLMRWLEDLINREIISLADTTGRYVFEWVGLGQGDALQDAETATAMLAAGQTTPRKVAAARDLELVPWVHECPLMDWPGSLEASLPLFLQVLQTVQAIQQGQQQSAMQMAGAQQQSDQQLAGMQAQQAAMAGMGGGDGDGAGAPPSMGGAAGMPASAGLQPGGGVGMPAGPMGAGGAGSGAAGMPLSKAIPGYPSGAARRAREAARRRIPAGTRVVIR
jgi:hypothetical protein